MPSRRRAVDAVAHRSEVQHHCARVFGQAPRPQREQTLCNRRRLVRQLVAARGLVVGKFQPVERRGRGQGRAAQGWMAAVPPERIELVALRGQQRIAAPEGVVIELLITQRQPVEPLGQQLREPMIDEAGGARGVETGGQRAGQAQAVIDLAEQEHAGGGGEVAPGKIGDDLAGAEVLKEQRLPGTVCGRGGGAGRLVWAFNHSPSAALPAPPFNLAMIFSG